MGAVLSHGGDPSHHGCFIGKGFTFSRPTTWLQAAPQPAGLEDAAVASPAAWADPKILWEKEKLTRKQLKTVEEIHLQKKSQTVFVAQIPTFLMMNLF